jgi:acetyltransferase-like isoleucine patch superfamily enzyme
MKLFLAGVYHVCVNVICMHVPVQWFRRCIVRLIGCRIAPGASILVGAEFHKPANVEIGADSVVGARCLLDARGGKLSIGAHVDIAQDVNIWTLQHDPDDPLHGTRGAGVVVEDYVWIASRATILPGVRLGRGAVVACGAVVTRDVKPLQVVGGVPARLIKMRNNPLTYSLGFRPWFR